MDSRTQAQSRVPRSAQETNHDNILVSVFNRLEAFFSLIFSTWLAFAFSSYFSKTSSFFCRFTFSTMFFSHSTSLADSHSYIFNFCNMV